MFIKNTKLRLLLGSATACLITAMLYAPISNAVVPNDGSTPEDIVDEEGGVNGVGMFFRNDGFVCTGTLINPRTVLFAAHCVNDRPEGDFGTTIQSAFSFNVNALPGFQNWLGNNFASNPDLNVFNINQIFWNADSVARPDGQGFLEGDIALASLDTPAAGIPTWALLFSQLPTPGAIDSTTGTGYHVNITGYGRSGSGTSGATVGIDFRRRAAENMLGALTSFDDRNTFLFGNAFGDLPQNLYRLDFDDPLAGAPGQSPFDFNLYRDEALPNEGTTAGGDSGGPLILDAANNDITTEDVVIGVLSGGSRFFGPQSFSSYGTESFFQPLFLFYEYIAANNPYRYASAIEGDGAWEDATHWQTDLDPNYRIIDADGNIVNGFPDEQQSGVADTGNPGFGDICFDTAGDNPGDGCQNLSTGDGAPPSRNGDTVSNNIGEVSVDILNTLGLGVEFAENSPQTGVELVEDEAQGGSDTNSGEGALNAPGDPLPAPTIDNGLPGATNFVPDNIDPPSGVNGTRRYFDVTLSNAGTTTLDSAVTIDRLTVAGNAGLNIGTGGSLTSLIDISQSGGRIAVDGALNSVGDYTLFSGMLSGSGTVTAPFFTSVMGSIAPGAIGTVDTLNIDGNAVLASGTDLLIDIGANGVNDLLTISGDSSLGGQVFFNPTADVRAGNSYTFLTTAGIQTGELTAEKISVILSAVLTHNANSVVATIEAGSYNEAIAANNAVQSSYAKLLDDGRGATALAPIFATLDLSSAAQIQTILDGWAPVTETTTQSLLKTTTDNLGRFHSKRLANMGTDNWGGGTVTVMGSPIQMASNSEYMTSISDVAYLQASSEPVARTTRNIDSNYAVYLSGAFIDGNGSAMPTTQNFADENFDGWSISAGVERYFSDKASAGVSLSYTNLEADASLGQSVESDHIAATAYGQVRSSSDIVLDGQVSVGSFGSKTSRTIALPAANALTAANTLTSDDNSLTYMLDLQGSKEFKFKGLMIKPKLGVRTTVVNFDDIIETGGLAALNIHRERFQSTQARLGTEVATQPSSNIQLRLSGQFVREYGDRDTSYTANFVGAGAGGAPFSVFGTDKLWGEVGGNVQFDLGKAQIDLAIDTTVARSDIDTQTYRAGVSFKF